MKIRNILITSFFALISYIIVGTLVEILATPLLDPYKEEMAILFKPISLSPDLKFIGLVFLVYFIFAIVLVSLYSILRESVPGKTSLQKGLSFGLIIWTLFILMPNILSIVNYKILTGLWVIICGIDLLTLIPGVIVAVVIYEKLPQK